jgi:hypothetical protein
MPLLNAARTAVARTAGFSVRRVFASLLLALGLLALQAAPAGANSHNHEAPEYSLSIVEGESTLPEYEIVSTSGSVHPSAPVAISIVRNGIVVAAHSGSEGGVWLSQVPQVGDVVNLESPVGTVVGSVVYDGLPSIDPTVCAGSTNFSGQRSGGETVEGGYYSLEVHTDHYGNTSLRRTSSGNAQVTVLSGSAFGGSFLTPLSIGQTVWASESLQTPLAGGATFTYSSENARPVGGCPAPPAAPAPPPPPPALFGSIAKLVRTTIHHLLLSGWVTQVSINQPGTVVEDLYQQEGTLPAIAASAGRHGKKRKGHERRLPPALLLARGVASAQSAGTVSVTLHPTLTGRRRLKHLSSVKAVLITTLHSNSGAKLTLERRSLVLHR